MDKDLAKKIAKVIVIFGAVILVIVIVGIIINNIIGQDSINNNEIKSVKEFKADYRKVFEGELFKVYVYKDGHANIVASEKLKKELELKDSIYKEKFESDLKIEKLLSQGIDVTFLEKSIKIVNAYEYIIGEKGEKKGIAFVLSDGQAAILYEDDIFKGESFIAKRVKNLKNVKFFKNINNINKKEESALNEGYNLVAVVSSYNMLNIVIDNQIISENMYVNQGKDKIQVSNYSDLYYEEFPYNLYINKSGYAYFRERPIEFTLSDSFTGFNNISKNSIENVFIGGTDDILITRYFNTSSLIEEFHYLFVAKNGKVYILPKTVIETESGDMFVAKLVNENLNAEDVEIYEFLEDNKKDSIIKNRYYTVVVSKDGTKKILNNNR